MGEKRIPRAISPILFVVLAASGLLYYAALSPQRFGRGHDDSVYLTTAKALATGEGYRIISLPYEPAQTKYPPFYPLLLSLIWRLYPHFPENLPWMMLLSAAAALGFLWITHRYLVNERYATASQGLIAISLTAVNWRFVILATSVYSEMLYGLLSVAVLCLAEKYEKRENRWMGGILVGALIGLAFLTRSVGLALLPAVCIYYALGRQWRKSLLIAGVGSLFVAGWIVWVYANRTTVEVVNIAYYTSYWRDVRETVASMQAGSNLPTVAIFAGIIGKNILGLILVSVPVVCLGISYESVVYFGFAFIFVAAGFTRQLRKGLRLLHIYIVLYLLINLPFPFPSYDRYLMPLLPFLLLYFVTELQALASLVRTQITQRGELLSKMSAGFIGLALGVAVCIALYNYGSETYWRLEASSLKKSNHPATEDEEVMRWIGANTNPSDVLICYRDLLYYLYTGRQGTQSVYLRYGGFIEADKTVLEGRVNVIHQIIKENNGRYLIINPSDFDAEYKPDLQRETLMEFAEQEPQLFVPVFRSSDLRTVVYRIESNPAPNPAGN
jgi:4-amino-4-deoxy-L-arabinose transferase-like glycosyltransferase